ncbi:conjugal transfer protein TraF [Marinomonas mediterranea]|uniref:conjugal transfer protein TraF n=1 Tax=Marinomonas mediterranea TaxID=119864 RepID=UPI0023495415|nr:conjugal transfer protein TraF [Marinomonas mediterranea]WCN12378.1 conjugal transfer protein TraF [Marinomonas mediterranea]
MKKGLLLATSLASSISFAASPIYQPTGSSFTLGTSVNKRALSTALYNPAAPFLMVNNKDGDRFRMGLFGPMAFGYELGQVDSLEESIDELDAKLDSDIDTVEEAEDVLDDVNKLISDLGTDATGKGMFSTQVPLFPMIYRSREYGAFMFDASLSGLVKGSFLDDEATLQGTTIQTQSSVYVKDGADLNFSFGYSRDIWANQYGMLVGGAKLNAHYLTLGKALLVLQEDDDIGDEFSDSLEDNQESTFGVGLDVGAIWVAENYQLGLTATNLNEPEFDYGIIGQNCSSLTGTQIDNCVVAAQFASRGEIASSETHVMERQVTIDGAVALSDKQWTLATSYDLFEVNDFVGDQYQWAVVSASYYGDSNWAPGFRIGYRKNMAGSELSYANLGMSLFKRFSMDLAYGLETIKVDGTEAPRSLNLSLGFQTAF